MYFGPFSFSWLNSLNDLKRKTARVHQKHLINSQISIHHLQLARISFSVSWFTAWVESFNHWWWVWVNWWWWRSLNAGPIIFSDAKAPPTEIITDSALSSSRHIKACERQNAESNPIRLAMVFITYQDAHNFQSMFDNLYFLFLILWTQTLHNKEVGNAHLHCPPSATSLLLQWWHISPFIYLVTLLTNIQYVSLFNLEMLFDMPRVCHQLR